jgi:hypothetical protein
VIEVVCHGKTFGATLTVREGADIAECGISAAYEACRQGRWPALRITERRIVICTVPFLQMLGLEVDTVSDDVRDDDEPQNSPMTLDVQAKSGDPARGHRSVNSILTKTSDGNQKYIPGPRRSRRG